MNLSIHEEDQERGEKPNPVVKYTLQPSVYTGPRAEEVLRARRQHLSAGQYHFYEKPLMLVEAQMQYCFDDKGKQFVDCYSNVCHVGHCHPHFVKQTSSAMHNIISNTRYLHPTIVRYAERLKQRLPEKLSVCYFVNSGSEANDLALRLARIHTQKRGVLCLQNAYHGTTASCTGTSTSLSTGTSEGTVDYQYCARDVRVAPVPDVYRGKYRGEDAGMRYAEHVREATDDGTIAAFLHESVQGVGGQIVYPQDYLKRAYKHVRNQGGVCIADEVQTGFGRTGSHYWAFEAQGVVPDILTLGKPIGNGFPLGAVLTTREIAQSFDGVQYFNTNGGNPVACAAGLAVLDIIEHDGLQQNALDVSEYLMDLLVDLQKKHPLIGDVRGVGLFVGIELVRDRQTLEPAADETKLLMELLKESGLLVGKGGQFNNVIRIKPPLCFNKRDAQFLVDKLDELIPVAVKLAKQRGSARRARSSQANGSRSSNRVLYVNRTSGRAQDAFDVDSDEPRRRRVDWDDDAELDTRQPAARTPQRVSGALAAVVEESFNQSTSRRPATPAPKQSASRRFSDDEDDYPRSNGRASAREVPRRTVSGALAAVVEDSLNGRSSTNKQRNTRNWSDDDCDDARPRASARREPESPFALPTFQP